ncbi:MAG: methylamine utilization protein [Halofilum sp. (in: g-proteobacteria)]|nr:methylamine utilization protein [Halofilum sp. (in: g-proteobacteria)]
MADNEYVRGHSTARPAGRWAMTLLIAAAAGPATATAATIEARVRSDDGPVTNAVVHATRTDGESLPRPAQPEAVMDQVGREFAPHVLPVLAGTSVRFPNSDDTRHHVYSFSDAKTFELQLYHGETARPVTFGEPGVVTLGCNIHDWMLGYILVLDTPAFARTGDNGTGRIADLPPGEYRVEVWHPRLVDGTSPQPRTITVDDGATATLRFDIELSPPRDRGQRGFGGQEDESLEEAFER